MQRKIAYLMLAVGVCAAIATTFHFAFAGTTTTVQPFTAANVTDGVLQMIGAVLLVATCVGLYFVPGIVASRRGAESTTGIILLNVLLGWTLIGWVAALIWAVSGESALEANAKRHALNRLLASTPYPSTTAAPPPPHT